MNRIFSVSMLKRQGLAAQGWMILFHHCLHLDGGQRRVADGILDVSGVDIKNPTTVSLAQNSTRIISGIHETFSKLMDSLEETRPDVFPTCPSGVLGQHLTSLNDPSNSAIMRLNEEGKRRFEATFGENEDCDWMVFAPTANKPPPKIGNVKYCVYHHSFDPAVHKKEAWYMPWLTGPLKVEQRKK